MSGIDRIQLYCWTVGQPPWVGKYVHVYISNMYSVVHYSEYAAGEYSVQRESVSCTYQGGHDVDES